MNVIDFIVIIIIGFFLTNFSIEKFQEGYTNKKSQIQALNDTNSIKLKNVTIEINTTMEKYDKLNSRIIASKKGDELGKKLKCGNHSSLPCGPPVTPLSPRKPKPGCPAKIIWPKGIDETKSKNINDATDDVNKMLNIRKQILEVYVTALHIEEAGNVIDDNLQILTSGKTTQLTSL